MVEETTEAARQPRKLAPGKHSSPAVLRKIDPAKKLAIKPRRNLPAAEESQMEPTSPADALAPIPAEYSRKKRYEYHSSRWHTRFLQGTVILYLVALLVKFVVLGVYWHQASQINSPYADPGTDAALLQEHWRLPLLILDGLLLLPALTAFVALLVWLHRICTNALAQGKKCAGYTPGWCVGWFFIPFANIVMPYHAIRSVFRAYCDYRQRGNLRFIDVWWWSTVVYLFVPKFLGYGEFPTQFVRALSPAVMHNLFYTLLLMLTLVFELYMLHRFSRLDRQMLASLTEREASSAPAPDAARSLLPPESGNTSSAQPIQEST